MLRILASAAAFVVFGGSALAMGNDPDQKVIRIMSATYGATYGASYGASCGIAGGNATRNVAAQCDGRKSCSYKVSYKVLGDPAYGCKKDFFVSYYCGRNGPFQGRAAAEAGYGSVVPLVCR